MANDSIWSIAVGTRLDDNLQQQLDKSKPKTITVTPIYNTKGVPKGTKEVQTFQNELNKTVQVTNKFNSEGTKTSSVISKTTEKFKDSTKEIAKNSEQTKKLGQTMSDIAIKVAKFYLVTRTMQRLIQSFADGVRQVKEFDASLIELRKVTDLSGSSLEKFTKQAFVMADELSTSATNVTDAVTEFAKSNYTLEESQVLARQAIIFQTIADGAISASDSATMLIQVMKAYNLTVNDSEHIINSINQISNNYAISSTELSSSIGKVASSAKTAGVDFENLLGLMTAGTEVTQNASKTANGLKSILVNLMSDKLNSQFAEFGLNMRDSNGAMKDGFTILKELSNAYNSMGLVADETGESLITTNDRMNSLLEDIGGKHNINTLTSILGNFDNAINATESAFNSANSASEEYATALDSIEMKTQAVKGAFLELMYADGGLSSFLKTILDGTKGLIDFANSGVGKTVIQLALITTALQLFNKVAHSNNIIIKTTSQILSGQLISQWKKYGAELKLAKTQQIELSKSAKELQGTLGGLKSIGISLAISAGIMATSKAMEILDDVSQRYYKTQRDIVEQSTENIDKETKENEILTNLASQLLQAKDGKVALKDIYKELNEYVGVPTDLLKGEADAYDLANIKIQALIKSNEALLLAEKKRRSEALISSAKSLDFNSSGFLHEISNYTYDDYVQYYVQPGVDIFDNLSEEEIKKGLKEFKASFQEAFGIMIDEGLVTNKNADVLSSNVFNTIIEGLVDKQEYTSEQISSILNDMLSNDKVSVAYDRYLRSFSDLNIDTDNAKKEFTKYFLEIQNVVEGTDAEEKLKSVFDALIVSASKSKKAINDGIITPLKSLKFTDIYTDIAVSLTDVIKAQNELAESGEISLDTLNSLILKYPELENQLVQTENGYTLNKSALDDLIQAKKDSYNFDVQNAVKIANEIITSQGGQAIAYSKNTDAIKNQTIARINALKSQLKELEMQQSIQKYKTSFLSGAVTGVLPSKNMFNPKINQNLISLVNNEISALDNLLNGINNQASSVSKVDTVVSQLKKNLTSVKSGASSAKKTVADDVKEIGLTFEEATRSAEKLRDMIISMIKDTTKGKIDDLQKELDKLVEIYNLRRDILDKQKETQDYQKRLSASTKEVSSIEARMLSLQYDNSREATAKRLQLEEELAKAKESLNDLVIENSYDKAMDKIDKEQQATETKYENQINKLQAYLDNEAKIMQDALVKMKNLNTTTYNELINWNKKYGDGLKSTIVDPWNEAITAIKTYKGVLSTISGTPTTGTPQNVKTSTTTTTTTKPTTVTKPPTVTPPKTVSATSTNYKIQKGDTLWDLAKKYYGNGGLWTKIKSANPSINPNNLKIGSTIKIPKYAQGTTSVGFDQLAMINELGDELVVRANGEGDISALTKGSGVIPANLTKNLMELGKYSPQELSQISNSSNSSVVVGDIIINGDSRLNQSDLNNFRRDIVNNIMDNIQHNKAKNGVLKFS